MLRTPAIALAVAVVVAGAVLAQTERNLLVNGTFEEGAAGAPRGWTGGEGATWDNSGRDAGGHSLKIERRAGAATDPQWRSQPVPCQAGVLISVSCSLKTQDVSQTDVSYHAGLEIVFADAAGKEVGRRLCAAANGTSDWRPYETEATVPAGAIAFSLVFRLSMANGIAWLDDVAVAKLAREAPLPLAITGPHPGNLFEPGEPIVLAIAGAGLSAPAEPPAYTITDERGWKLTGGRMGEWKEGAGRITLPPGGYRVGGYYRVSAALVRDGKTVASGATSFAVVPAAQLSQAPAWSPFGGWFGLGSDEGVQLAIRAGCRTVYPIWEFPGQLDRMKAHRLNISTNALCRFVPWVEWNRSNGATSLLPKDPEAYKRDVTAFVRAAGGAVRTWGLYGESPFWNDDMARQVVELYRLGYPAVKAGDPAALVLVSGICDRDRVRQLFELGGAPHFDGLQLNYCGDSIETTDADLKYFRGLFRQYGCEDKVIQLAETWTEAPNISTPIFVAADLTKIYTLGLAYGCLEIDWHCVNGWATAPSGQDPLPCFDSNSFIGSPQENYAVRPVFLAHYNLTQKLSGATFDSELDLGPAIKAFLFRRGDKSVLVMWSRSVGAGAPSSGQVTRAGGVALRGMVAQSEVPTVNLCLQTKAQQLAVSDIMNRSFTLRPLRGLLALDVGPSPIYLTSPDDLRDLRALPASFVPSGASLHVRPGLSNQLHWPLRNPLAKATAGTLQVTAPPGWTVRPQQPRFALPASGKTEVALDVQPPPLTTGRYSLCATLTSPTGVFGRLALPLVCEPGLAVDVWGVPATRSAAAELRVRLKNCSPVPVSGTLRTKGLPGTADTSTWQTIGLRPGQTREFAAPLQSLREFARLYPVTVSFGSGERTLALWERRVSFSPSGPRDFAGTDVSVLLTDFEDQDLVSRHLSTVPSDPSITVELADDWHSGPGRRALKALYRKYVPGANRWPLAAISSPLFAERRDWRTADEMTLDVYNPNDFDVSFCACVSDFAGVKYEESYWENCCVPARQQQTLRLATSMIGGPVNLGNVARLRIIMTQPERETTLYFDSLRLVVKGERD